MYPTSMPERDPSPARTRPGDHPERPAMESADRAGSHCPLCRPARAQSAPPFAAQFTDLPPDRVTAGYLALGQWWGDEYEREMEVALRLGPDGGVWARVGALADVPLLPLEERQELARRVLADFVAAYADWARARGRVHPTPNTLAAWPADRLTTWLFEAAWNAPPELGALMTGVLAELRALGFRVAPVE